jgi:hypothetical protein
MLRGFVVVSSVGAVELQLFSDTSDQKTATPQLRQFHFSLHLFVVQFRD